MNTKSFYSILIAALACLLVMTSVATAAPKQLPESAVAKLAQVLPAHALANMPESNPIPAPQPSCSITNPSVNFPVTCGSFTSDGKSLLIQTSGEANFAGSCINGIYTNAATGASHEIAPSFSGCYGTSSDQGLAGDGQISVPLTGGIYGQYGLCYNAVGSGNTFRLTEIYPFVSSPGINTFDPWYKTEYDWDMQGPYVYSDMEIPYIQGLNLTFTC